MTDVSILHPTLGRSVKNGATDTCSKCGHTIPEGHVPLILWNESGDLMWVYCEKCDGPDVSSAVSEAGGGALMTITVPWNTMWTGELHYEVRPCRWAEGKLALWQPHRPGEGRPLFKKPHNVRQRQSVARLLCTVCGEPTPPNNRWWFKLGQFQEGWFMTTEAPVHRACADIALSLCPHLQSLGAKPSPFPTGHTVLLAVVGGPATEEDFGVRLNGRTVIGSLKLAWPASMFQVRIGGVPLP